MSTEELLAREVGVWIEAHALWDDQSQAAVAAPFRICAECGASYPTQQTGRQALCKGCLARRNKIRRRREGR